MSKKGINTITFISFVLVVIGVILAYYKFDTYIWLPFVLASMVLIRFMIYKLKKNQKNKKEYNLA